MSGAASLAIRLAIAGGAVAICLAIAGSERSERRCSEAGAAVVRDVTGTASAPAAGAATEVLLGDCTDTRPLVIAAATLARAGRAGEAEPLARRAVAREPENPGAWAALYFALVDSDRTAAARARSRAEELNPPPAR